MLPSGKREKFFLNVNMGEEKKMREELQNVVF